MLQVLSNEVIYDPVTQGVLKIQHIRVKMSKSTKLSTLTTFDAL